ncbi:ubiquitinyl hydrolase 1 [Necator americanus]|uniref:Ubiquitin carboxyl-terminal hydrolase 39 n=1 Tax=Necator americanus TaxID=51031 RepID=W2SRQ0_NECAM|nr:ubiquitinyl hydrolase 1 [Necator americanus]ETN72198.1 ubiquitinyl hydrolase 1 [Necator americanus]
MSDDEASQDVDDVRNGTEGEVAAKNSNQEELKLKRERSNESGGMSDDEASQDVDDVRNGTEGEVVAKNSNQEELKLKRERSNDSEKSPSPPSKKAKSNNGQHDSERKKSTDDEKEGESKPEDSRSRSPDVKRRRSGKDKSKNRKKDEKYDNYKENSRKERVSNTENNSKADALEEGEVVEPAREPTARELERMRLIEQLAKEDAEITEPSSSVRDRDQGHNSRACPYLDTIDRKVLDFDFEKLCSVSLSHLNVYACMVCGKYFQGRGTNTHAYTHSLDTDHRVFLNLHTLKFYCLPDNYEVDDPSLEDIKYVLKPTYTKELIAGLDRQHRMARAYDDSTYFPGVVGLNNIKANDYCNVVLHALSHVTPLRDYFLREENYESIKRPPGDKLSLLPKRFGELIRKLWNPKAFRTHVSPHEMLQATVSCSDKKFQFIKQGDAAEFMSFLLNTLHIALNGTQKSSSSIIYKIFRGRMRQYSRKVIPAEATECQRQQLLQLPEYNESAKELPFLYLALDLPPAPLYRDEQMQNIIPQVPLTALLQKFNGTTEKEYKTYNENIMKRFELLRLPEYLIITYKRFHKNQWFVEKNPTIVNFPISNVDLFDCLSEDTRREHKYTTYDLVANIVHDGKPDSGTYRIQLVHVVRWFKGSRKWFELEDLHVKEILPQMIVLAESYIQIWKLNRRKTREERMSEVVDDDTSTS